MTWLESISESAKVFFLNAGIDVYVFVILLLVLVFLILFWKFIENHYTSVILAVFLTGVVVIIAYVLEPEIMLHFVDLLKIMIKELIASI